MSSLARWDPTAEMTSLHDAVSQLMERAVMRPGFSWGSTANSYSQMNVFEADGRYYCQVLLPGASPDDIDLTVRQNTLTLKGKIAESVSPQQRKDIVYLLHEFGGGEFTRSISFPKDVRGDAVEARYENGILTIVVPVAEHAQPRRITIQRESDQQAQKQVVEGQPTATSPAGTTPELAGAVSGSNTSASH